MGSCLKSLFGLKKKIYKVKKIFQGSKNDPLFCLGVSSVIFLAFISLASGSIADSLYNKGDFSIASLSNDLQEPVEEEVFAGLSQKSWPESPEFLLLGDSSLKAVSPPSTFSPQALGALVGGYEFADAKRIITEYVVEPGDTLSGISGKFSISLNTLLWANSLSKGSLIQPGQKLTILPVSGVIYHVKPGDTISEIADKYKGKLAEIITFNNLSDEGDIYVGDIVIIPDGEEPKASYQYAPSSSPLADSYFICPIASPCIVTQNLHWYNAIDFSHGKCGEVIYAAAAGEVLKVKLTSSTSRYALNGYGNHMTILHPNGVVTYYGHISTALVSQGDKVSQGQPIALMGGRPGTPGAGNSTGCHVHFGVSGSRNPFSK
ncbi:MAG: M23 family metallopeptidase [Candidatus Nealsonbacteria bacterium]